MPSALRRRQFMKSAALGAAAAATAGVHLASAAETAAPPLRIGSPSDGVLKPTFEAPSVVRPLLVADLNDLEAEARKVMDPGAFAFISSGSDSQWTLRENRKAFERLVVKPQYLVGKPQPDLRIELLGQKLALPIITTPMGAHGLAHQSAELGTARGTAEAGTLMTVSTTANYTIEEIAAASKGPKWFQLYLLEDEAKSRELLRRAEAAGYHGIVLSIDAFAPGASDSTLRMGFGFPPTLPLVNVGHNAMKKSLSWEDVKFVMKNTRLPLVLKGVLTPEMAKKAIDHGVAGIQVSNHGGRQLDGVSAAMDALPAVVDVVRGRVPVIMDSGIRRGTDVFKALAMGANAVAIGRPVLYALSLGGWMGVKSAYERLSTELSRDMLIAGLGSVSEFKRDFIMRAPGVPGAPGAPA